MTGSDLIVAVPWLLFGLSLGFICLRLRRSPAQPGRPRDRPAQQPDEVHGASQTGTRRARG